MQCIYDDKFPLFHKTYFQGVDLPSYGAFERAKNDAEFSNIKKRTKHFHLRCSYCSILTEQRRAGFKTKQEESINRANQRAHEKQVRKWHEAEMEITLQASHSPESVQVFKMDDTQSTHFPHCSMRLPKSIAKHYKLGFVPCLLHDVNSRQKTYIYSLKGQHKKGGNRFCTTMYHAFKAAKHSWPSASARHAIIIGVQ